MRFRYVTASIALLLLPLIAAAQPGHLALPDFSALEKKATSTVNISLDPTMLHLAAGFLNVSPNSLDEDTKSLIEGVQGIYVRSFEFDQTGAYSKADVDAVRAQLTSPAWMPLVSTHDRSQQEDVDIYIHRNGQRTEGVAIISAQPKQLTIVNIVGSIDLQKLAQLQGKFGVPKISGMDATR